MGVLETHHGNALWVAPQRRAGHGTPTSFNSHENAHERNSLCKYEMLMFGKGSRPSKQNEVFRPMMAMSTRRAIIGLSANGYTPIALSVRKLAPLSNDCYDYQIASFVL